MITSRDQYAFVDLSQVPEMRIDGGILPARDVAGDGSWRVLRGEDAAFLQEAARERGRAATGATGLPHEMTKTLSAARLEDAAGRLRSCFVSLGYCKAPPTSPAPVYDAPADATAVTAYGLGWSDAEIPPAARQFSRLRADDLRGLFREVAILRRFSPATTGAGYAVANETGPDYDSTVEKEDPSRTPDPPAPLGLVDYFCDDGWRGTGREWACVTRDSTARAGVHSLAVPEPARPWIASARAFARLGYYSSERAPGAEEATATRHLVAPVESSLDGNAVAVPLAGLLAAAEAARAFYGFTKRGLGSGWTQQNRVVCEDLFFVLELTDHTDFASLGWQWQPA